MKNFSKRIATITATLALVVVLGVTLAACGSKGGYKALTADEYNANLTYYGYSTKTINPESDDWEDTVETLKKSSSVYNNIQWVIKGNKNVYSNDDYRRIEIYCFSDNDSAKTTYNKWKSNLQIAIDNATTAEQEAELKKYKLALAGNVVINATTQDEIDAAYRKN